MTQKDLDRAIARATGESLDTIRRFGFSTLEPSLSVMDTDGSEHEPRVVDWDSLDRQRRALAVGA